MASSSNGKAVRASAAKKAAPYSASTPPKSTPATPDSVAIADRIESFQYKARYSKNVLSKYERLTREG